MNANFLAWLQQGIQNGTINVKDPAFTTQYNQAVSSGNWDAFNTWINQQKNSIFGGATEGGALWKDYQQDVSSGKYKDDPNAVLPGQKTALQTQQADATKAQLDQTIAGLQTQAATGNGAWQDQLKQTTQNNVNNAQSLGASAQNNLGLNKEAARQATLNAQTGAQTQSAGEGVILQNQEKQGAQNLLSQLYANEQNQNMTQAQDQAQAQQGINQLNQTMAQNAQQNGLGMLSGIASNIMMAASKGGEVPGEAPVFGDDERNDTVKAKLSPGEIVIPRSIAMQQNADQLAALFVRETKERESKNKSNYDNGGEIVGGQTPIAGGNMGWLIGPNPTAPTIGNGGLLNLGQFNATDTNWNALAQLMQPGAAGNGPGQAITQQKFQDTQDKINQNAGFAGANAEGRSSGQAAQANNISAATKAGQQAAGQSGIDRLNYQLQGQQSLGDLLSQKRASEINQAEASQKANWENTLFNAKLQSQQMQSLMKVYQGVSSAAGMMSGMMGGGGGNNQPPPMGFNDPYGDQQPNQYGLIGTSSDQQLNGSSPPGDYVPPTQSDFQYSARGGMIKKRKGKKNGR